MGTKAKPLAAYRRRLCCLWLLSAKPRKIGVAEREPNTPDQVIPLGRRHPQPPAPHCRRSKLRVDPCAELFLSGSCALMFAVLHFTAVKKSRRGNTICLVGDREVVSLSSHCRSDSPTCRGARMGDESKAVRRWERRRLCCFRHRHRIEKEAGSDTHHIRACNDRLVGCSVARSRSPR
jgi:hypothetical protein